MKLLGEVKNTYSSNRYGHETLCFVPRLTGLPAYVIAIWHKYRRAGFFSDLFTSRFREAGLRIPFDRLRTPVSPIPKSRKEWRPPASLSRNDFMAVPVTRIPQGAALLALAQI
jgi:hypothetical protein